MRTGRPGRNGCTTSSIGLVVAAVAESADLTLLHHDAGFEVIAARTALRTRWLAKPGTA
ncbi:MULTISPECIES: hypothetical protein [unclassified Streptomyces]|uniref:hypothetical protein n=1 Tax=unclassified Streptomyces TaxID=2593676 RepID=UPI000A81536F|nr:MULTISPECIES: hypothetical protein [unclassified Streptomyces]